jgi:opacity protein-like surface antigen
MKHVAVALGVLAALAASASPGFAQDRRGDLAAGWQYLQAIDEDDDDFKLSKGFFVDAAGNVTPMFAVIGEFSAGFKTEAETIVNAGVTFDVSADVRLQTFMGGVRIGAPARHVVRPFAQILLGGVRRSADVNGSVTAGGVTISENESESATDFGFDLGGGVDFMLRSGLGVRAKASYLRVTGDSGGNALRFQAGVVIPF